MGLFELVWNLNFGPFDDYPAKCHISSQNNWLHSFDMTNLDFISIIWNDQNTLIYVVPNYSHKKIEFFVEMIFWLTNLFFSHYFMWFHAYNIEYYARLRFIMHEIW